MQPEWVGPVHRPSLSDRTAMTGSSACDIPLRPCVAIQWNPHSGSGSARKQIFELVTALRRRGIWGRVFSDRFALDRWILKYLDRTRLLCVVAVGGDGTIRDLIERLPDVPIAILPRGTENLLARWLGTPRSPERLADWICRRQIQAVDLAELNGRTFVVVASAGFDAQVIHLAHAARRGHISRLRYIRHIVAAVMSYRFPEIRVYCDDDPTPVVGTLALVVNVPAYALGLNLAPEADVADGWLEIRVIPRRDVLSLLGIVIWTALFGGDGIRSLIRRRAQRVRLESGTTTPVQCDGDPAGFTPCTISVLPSAGRLVCNPDT
jgi:diacylglycerol kinase family enzyme